jgi:hypothetical protein
VLRGSIVWIAAVQHVDHVRKGVIKRVFLLLGLHVLLVLRDVSLSTLVLIPVVLAIIICVQLDNIKVHAPPYVWIALKV